MKFRKKPIEIVEDKAKRISQKVDKQDAWKL